MKKIALFAVFFFSIYLLAAQRSFYMDPSDTGCSFIRENLKKSFQFIAKSQVASDYFIKTETIITPVHTTIVKITMQDSATFKTILEVSDEYNCNSLSLNPKLLQSLYLKTLADNYSQQFIYWAKRNNLSMLMLLLKEKKDKT